MKLLLICNIYQKIFWALFSLVWCGFRHVKTNFQISTKSATLDLWQYNTTRNARNVSISYLKIGYRLSFIATLLIPPVLFLSFVSLAVAWNSCSLLHDLAFAFHLLGFAARVLWRWLKIERKIDTCVSIVSMKRCFVLSCRIVSFAFRYKGENGKLYERLWLFEYFYFSNCNIFKISKICHVLQHW